jgi:hypothetical protein
MVFKVQLDLVLLVQLALEHKEPLDYKEAQEPLDYKAAQEPQGLAQLEPLG